MKKIAFIIALLPLFAIGQTKNNELPEQGLPEKDERVFIEQVITLKDSTIKKTRLFSVAKDWVSKTFKDSKSVIDYEDKEEGKLVCKGLTKESFKAILGGRDEITLSFTIDFTFKDGKYRIQVYNLQPKESNYSFSGSVNPMWNDFKIDIDQINNDYNNKKEIKERVRKNQAKKINQIASMIKPVFENAIDYISKNSTINKEKDF